MKVGKCAKVWHIGSLLLHLLDPLISLLKSLIHLGLSGGHLCLDFFDGLDMSIIFFLFNWFGWLSWHGSELSLLHGNLLVNSLFSSDKHLLELCGLSLSLSNSLNMLSVFINGWVFSLLLGLLFSLLFFFFSEIISFLYSVHLIEWLVFWNSCFSGSSDGSCQVIGF